MSQKETIHGICRLCGNPSALQISHIVSKFLIRQAGLLGAKFSLVCHTNPDLTEINRQDGIKESLLCRECEDRLQVWEDYTSRQLYGKTGLLRSIPNNSFTWQGLDYAKLKLFLVSIIWRMSVSKHPLYSGVELGDKHENLMANMLLTANPLEAWRYGAALAYLHWGGKPFAKEFFNQPRRYHSGYKSSSYRFMIANFAVNIDIGSHRPDILIEQQYLQVNGTWQVDVMEALSIPWVKEEIDLFRKIAGTTP